MSSLDAVLAQYEKNKQATSSKPRMSDEDRLDKRCKPVVRDCTDKYGEWYYNLRGSWGNPKVPRNAIRYSLLNDDYDYNSNRRANDLRKFLKLVGIEGDLKIGTIKLVHTSEL